jgi:hypothetical protein
MSLPSWPSSAGQTLIASAGGLDFKALAEQYGKLTVREITSGSSGLALAQREKLIFSREPSGSEGRYMSERHISWDFVAGFFDGEGSVVNDNNERYTLNMGNTNREILEVIKDFIGCGNIHITYQKNNERGAHRKTMYNLRITHHLDCLRVAKELVGRCIIKREKLQEAINYIESKKWLNHTRPLINVSKEEIYNLYWNKNLTTRQIGEIYNTHHINVLRFMKINNIPRRPNPIKNAIHSGDTTRNIS